MNGYVVPLILVLVVILAAVFIKGFQRHDPPRHHHWPAGLDAGEDAGEDASHRPPAGDTGKDSSAK